MGSHTSEELLLGSMQSTPGPSKRSWEQGSLPMTDARSCSSKILLHFYGGTTYQVVPQQNVLVNTAAIFRKMNLQILLFLQRGSYIQHTRVYS